MMFLAWLACALSLSSVFFVFFFRSKNKAAQEALEKAKKRENELKETLVSVLDGEGNVRGSLMLPGYVATDEATKQLKEAETTIKTLLSDLRQEKANNKNIELIVGEINKNHALKIRLPGEKVIPNTTPCGSLCRFSYWKNHTDKYGAKIEGGDWRCIANQGIVVDHSRPKFLDANKQCVMFERAKS